MTSPWVVATQHHWLCLRTIREADEGLWRAGCRGRERDRKEGHARTTGDRLRHTNTNTLDLVMQSLSLPFSWLSRSLGVIRTK